MIMPGTKMQVKINARRTPFQKTSVVNDLAVVVDPDPVGRYLIQESDRR